MIPPKNILTLFLRGLIQTRALYKLKKKNVDFLNVPEFSSVLVSLSSLPCFLLLFPVRPTWLSSFGWTPMTFWPLTELKKSKRLKEGRRETGHQLTGLVETVNLSKANSEARLEGADKIPHWQRGQWSKHGVDALEAPGLQVQKGFLFVSFFLLRFPFDNHFFSKPEKAKQILYLLIAAAWQTSAGRKAAGVFDDQQVRSSHHSVTHEAQQWPR